MSNPTPQQNPGNSWADSLDIGLDIFAQAQSQKIRQISGSTSIAQNTYTPPPIQEAETTDLARILNETKAIKCPCCDEPIEDRPPPTGRPIYVEVREGADPEFLDEDDIAPTVAKAGEKRFSKEEVCDQIINLIKDDKFDPARFTL